MATPSSNRPAWLIAACTCVLGIAAFIPLERAAAPPAPLAPPVQRALDRITANSLRGDLSFLASDAMKGRYSPSPELDLAAEFIAAQFRKAGLETGGDDGYFQTLHLIRRAFGQPTAITVQESGRDLSFPADEVRITSSNHALSVKGAPVVFTPSLDPTFLEGIELGGKVVVMPRKSPYDPADDVIYQRVQKRMAFMRLLEAKGALALLSVGRELALADSLFVEDDANRPGVPRLTVSSDAATDWAKTLEKKQRSVSTLRAAEIDQRISFELPEPHDQAVTMKNVVGILRGSDPSLKSSAVVVSAHYDHIGTTETAGRLAMTPATPTDRIYNGANDDGSGTVSVIAIASALSSLRPSPKRSIVFVTFCGEEIGEYGSRWFASHTPFPIGRVVAGINLEQVGRTDSTHGSQVRSLTITGYDFSNLSTYLKQAGRITGVQLVRDPQGDAFFDRSDNASLAVEGVPAHTVSTAFEYPDYHAVGDEWQKIDYANMAKIDQAVTLAVLNIANTSEPLHWNASNPKTLKYREARHGSQANGETATH